MPHPDTLLLRQWTARRDAEAFNELVIRHADAVYATCRRILRNDADAEDVSQECFLRLARQSEAVRSSVGGWLHRVATTKSLDRIRSDARRREREQRYETEQPRTEATEWNDIQPCIDEAINGLPREQRDVIIAHFLERRTQVDIAQDFGINRNTVQRRIQRGVEQIRGVLRAKQITTAALTGMLASNTAQAAPAPLAASLGRIALEGGSAGAAGIGAATAGFLTKPLLVGLLVGATVLAGAVLLRPEPASPSPSAKSITPVVAAPEQDDRVQDSDVLVESETTERVTASSEPSTRDSETVTAAGAATTNETALIAGRILDEIGGPIADAEVRLIWMKRPEGMEPGPGDDETLMMHALPDVAQHRVVKTDADGIFSVDDVPAPGMAMLAVSAAGYVWDEQNEISYAPGDIKDDLVYALEPGLRRSGRVLTHAGDPVPHAVLFGDPGLAVAGLAGRFEIGVEMDEDQMWFMLMSKSHGLALSFGYPVHPEEEWEVRYPEPGSLSGTVRHADGSPATGYRVQVMFDDVAVIEGAVDQRGNYHLAPTPEIGEDEEGVRIVAPDGMLVSVEHKLDRFEGELAKQWDYTLPAPITVRGQVRGMPSKQGLPGYTVVCKMKSKLVAYGRSDGDGSYELSIPTGDGSYKLSAIPGNSPNSFWRKSLDAGGGFVGTVLESNLMAGQQKNLNIDCTDPVTVVARFEDGSGRTPKGTRVEGHVRSESSGNFSLGRIQPDAAGVYRCAAVPPGLTVYFTFNAPGHAEAVSSFRVGESGEVLPLETVRVHRATSLTARVLRPNGEPHRKLRVDGEITLDDGHQYPVNLPHGSATTYTIGSLAGHTQPDGSLRILDAFPATIMHLRLTAYVPVEDGRNMIPAVVFEGPVDASDGAPIALGDFVLELHGG
jgi:RNA polymerase sigma-70 factor (ECF subfamily)